MACGSCSREACLLLAARDHLAATPSSSSSVPIAPPTPAEDSHASHPSKVCFFTSGRSIPLDVWFRIGDMLTDRCMAAMAAATRACVEPMASEVMWIRRAIRVWQNLPGFSDSQRGGLVSGATSRAAYAARRTLLRGKRAVLLGDRREAGAMVQIVQHCGGMVVGSHTAIGTGSRRQSHRGKGKDRSLSEMLGVCNLLLLCKGGGQRQHLPKLGEFVTFSAAWLHASCTAGCQLPMHRPGCPSTGSSYSLPRSCIAPDGTAEGSDLCCYAPRLLEGLLVTSTGIPGRDALAATVRALGGLYTEELTGDHTHLIAAAPAEGPKFEFARAQQIPVVSPGWLEETLRVGAPMQERCFPVRSYV